MAALGIDVVLPPRAYLQSELPVLTPLAAGLIRRPGELAILDAGGNNVGARVLAALGDASAGRRRPRARGASGSAGRSRPPRACPSPTGSATPTSSTRLPRGRSPTGTP